MIQRIVGAVAIAILVCGVASVVAHEEFRIIGTLARHQGSKIDVKKNTGKTVSLRLDKQTAISQNNKKVDATALRAGQSLVVDAYGDREDDALAVEIRIVPPIRGGGQ
jgi:hypothetical protein